MCNWIRFWTAARKPPKTLYLPQLYICSNRLSNPDSPSALSKSGVFNRNGFHDSVEIPSGSLKRAPLCLAPHALLPHTPAPQTPTSRVPNTGHFSTPNPSAQPPIPVQTTTHPPNPKNPPKSPFRQHPRPFAGQEMFAVPLRPPRPAHARAQRTPKHPSVAQRTSMNWPAFDSMGLSNGVARNLSETAQGKAMRSSRQRQTRGAQPAVQGSITSSPIPSKASTSLVATAAPRLCAIAAIWQSAWLMGRPAARRSAAIMA